MFIRMYIFVVIMELVGMHFLIVITINSKLCTLIRIWYLLKWKQHVLTKRYNNNKRIKQSKGNKSKKKLKNKNSAIKKIEPGKPKKIKQLISENKKSLGHIKLIPLSSVIKRVLKRRFIASTNKKEFVESSAWLINIQNPDKKRQDCPLMIQMVSQCISTTVE